MTHSHLTGKQAGDFCESMRVLVKALAAACKADGRISIDGTEYTVQPVSYDSPGEWVGADQECSIKIEPFFHEWHSLDGVRRRMDRIISHQLATIYVNGTTSQWELRPIGQVVPGQRRIDHQAGSPKPEPEIIHPEEENWDDVDY